MSARGMFGLRNRVVFVSLVLIPTHLYSLAIGDMPAELHDTPIALALLALATLAMLVLFWCWAEILFGLIRTEMESPMKLLWMMTVLLAPYGLIGYYYRFHVQGEGCQPANTQLTTTTIGRLWVFNGVQSAFPSGVFSNRDIAESWIRRHTLTGTLTLYPVDSGMYDYAIDNGFFVPKKEAHTTSLFIGKFTGGGVGHFHYEDGIECAGGREDN